jgi:hypothetical protein
MGFHASGHLVSATFYRKALCPIDSDSSKENITGKPFKKITECAMFRPFGRNDRIPQG